MSGFDPGWLALREPVDHASRNARIQDMVRRHFAARASLTVIDLGCGTGSNLRGLAPLLSPRQHWHLIDGDPALLRAARGSLAAWADSVRDGGDEMWLHKGGSRIRVSFECADLMSRDLRFSALTPHLVTAAALFDLVSLDWLECLVAASAEHQVPLYGVLNYNGVARWRPQAPLDDRIIAAFNRHQQRDKGFGPALGPAASSAFSRLLSSHGYRTWQADSPWRLGVGDRSLIGRLSAGFAKAAAEIEPQMTDPFAAWGCERADAEEVTIGHTDIFAVV